MGCAMDTSFEDWLQTELDERGWSQAELIRRSKNKIGSGSLSDIFSGRRKIGLDLATAIAEAFEMPVVLVLQAAKLIPPDHELTDEILKIVHLLEKMTEEEQKEFLAYVRFRINQKNK